MRQSATADRLHGGMTLLTAMETWSESKAAHEAACRCLAKAKAEEAAQERMYTWTHGSLTVGRNTARGLRETVKALGYEWNEGTAGE